MMTPDAALVHVRPGLLGVALVPFCLAGLLAGSMMGAHHANSGTTGALESAPHQRGVRPLHILLPAHGLQPAPGVTAAGSVSRPSAPGKNPGLRGRHVLIGIVDTGIDYRNPDFTNANGSTRIKYIWDQTANGTPPAGYTFGDECDNRSIDRGTCPERDTDGHGTHVAGIAAANGRSGGRPVWVGLAPQADILVVKTDFGEHDVIAAWKYLISRAKQLREPIVINNSFGGQNGPHDGSEPEARAIDALSGPGVIFVAAAGNDGRQGKHASGWVGRGETRSLTITASGSLSELALAVYYSARDTLIATLSNPHTGQTFRPLGIGTTIDSRTGRNGETEVSVDTRRRNPGHNSVIVDLNRLATGQVITGTWRLTLTGRRAADGGRYDAWLLTGQDGVQAINHPDESDTLSSPADAHSVIAVANYATRVQWTDRNGDTYQACDYTLCADGVLRNGDIALYSSLGPTADGRQKPDIAAPGVLISASRSADVPVCKHTASDSENCVDPVFITRDGRHVVDTGTSMSSAYVSGVVALMLQADPLLRPAAADAILRSTARHDRFTGRAAWTPTFGAGKIDPAAAVEKTIACAGRSTSTPARADRPADGTPKTRSCV